MAEEVKTDGSLFREPRAPSPETFNTAGYPHSDVTPDEFPEQAEVKPSERLPLGKDPLLVELLVGPAYKTFNVETLTNEVDEFINSEIKRLHLKDDKETYEQMLQGFMKRLSLSDQTDIYTNIEKIHEYTLAQKKLLEAIEEHEELMAADPLSLKPDKMLKVLTSKYGIKVV